MTFFALAISYIAFRIFFKNNTNIINLKIFSIIESICSIIFKIYYYILLIPQCFLLYDLAENKGSKLLLYVSLSAVNFFAAIFITFIYILSNYSFLYNDPDQLSMKRS